MTTDTFFVVRTCDDEVYSESPNNFFYELSKVLAFDDCSGDTVTAIFYEGKEINYVGWQPCMKYEYQDLNGNTVWSGSFPEWEH